MPSVVINSFNINTFSFTVKFDIQNKTVTFDASASTYNNNSGQGLLYVLAQSYSLVDQDGVELAVIDFTNPANYVIPSTTQIFTVDLSSLNYAFLFQTYKIIGAIKDADGTVYQTTPLYKNVCQPTGFTETGYVSGMFNVIADCVNNTLSVKEITVLVYNGKTPSTTTKSGTLYYPTGTINPVAFTGTPFSNNVVYTGQYSIVNNTIGEYDLGDGVLVDVTYYTNNVFDIICGSKMSDLNCCLQAIEKTAISQCDNAIGQAAKQQLADVSMYYMLGVSKEINGQDSTFEYEYIKKYLSCNCGVASIQQNEQSPINPSVYNILVVGTNGTGVAGSVIGSTQKFTVSSNVYQIAKGNTGDLAFTLQIDNSVSGITKTIITFNYAVMAGYILTAIGNSNTLISQLNALVTATTNIDLSNLNGKCIIDLSSINYFLSQLMPSGFAIVDSIIIGSTTYNAPAALFINNTAGIESWLNGLALGIFSSSYSVAQNGAYINIVTNGNANNPVSVTFNVNNSPLVVTFQKTNTSLISLLQAVIDYLCQLSSLKVALGNNLKICSFDYSGNVITTSLITTNSQNDFNSAAAAAICNIADRINTLTGITCSKVTSLFQDYPNASFGVNDRFLSVVGGNCTSLTGQQAALAVIASINAYSNVKAAFCAIDCTAPASCPDISGTSIAMSGSNIGFYGLTWASTPIASQTVTLQYRVTGTLAWTVVTNALIILPNGNISGTTPYAIMGVSMGITYDVQVINNCGGVGFINQITTPTGGIYSGSFLRDSVIYNVCGDSPVTLYSNAPFATGITMYVDAGLTTPLTGYLFIASTLNGTIYNINTSTGVVGSTTGSNCSVGTSGSYTLGTSTGTICSQSPSVLYTSGAFAVGKTLFIDSSLTHPQTEFTYVVFNNAIYNLNTSTGVIGSSTGLSCITNSTLTATYSAGGWDFSLSDVLPFSLALSSANARGGTSNTCASFSQTDALTPLTIAAGSSNASQVNNGLTCSSTFYRIDNTLTVNGNTLTNGGTVVISGVTVTVVIMHTVCSNYAC